MTCGVEYFLHQWRDFQHTGMGRKLGKVSRAGSQCYHHAVPSQALQQAFLTAMSAGRGRASLAKVDDKAFALARFKSRNRLFETKPCICRSCARCHETTVRHQAASAVSRAMSLRQRLRAR
jgi:hypothetical protein